jgi:hypothetical protein
MARGLKGVGMGEGQGGGCGLSASFGHGASRKEHRENVDRDCILVV